jgi:hypothetical protein
MSSFHNNALVGASGQAGYQIERSLRFNSADSAYLNRTPASAGNRTTWTLSMWVKRSKITSGGGANLMSLFGWQSGGSGQSGIIGYSSSTDTLSFNQVATTYRITNAVFRDVSAWAHLVFVWDSNNATDAQRCRIYVNGSEATYSTSLSIASGTQLDANSTVAHGLGADIVNVSGAARDFFDGYLTEINFIDGQALTPSNFGETDTITGVWKPKRYAGTYGTNGFYLKFADNSGTTSTTLGKDSSGNGNNWTPNNFSVTAGAGNDSMIDTPTPYADGGNGRGNYATWNPLDRTAATYSNGNLDVTSTSAASPYNMASTMRFPATGKWYAEVTLTGLGAGSPSIGIGKNNSDAYAVYRITGTYLTSGMGASTSGTPNTYTTNNVIGIAYDAGAGTLEFYKNGVDQTGNISGITASTEWAIILRADSASGDAATLNAGQRAFAYTPPSGFLALNTQNLPEPSIKKPNQWMDINLATGNNSTQTITNAGGFQPDLVWMKIRSASENHILYDSARGTDNFLVPNLTNAAASGGGQGLTSFNSNGFTLGSINPNYAGSPTFVAWQWKESATPGFDIVTYTGNGSNRTIAHSLGVDPKLGFIKRRDSTSDWSVYYNFDGLGAGVRYLTLNSTAASVYDPTYWNSSVWTSTLMQLGTNGAVNTNSATYVAYLWSEVAGFSKFGSFTGNGSTDGPFVFCGFRPRWVMIKRTDGAGSDWVVWDAVRSTTNLASGALYPNGSFAQDGTDMGDFLSNGIKFRQTVYNVSSGTYIFAAFAESPFKYSLAR